MNRTTTTRTRLATVAVLAPLALSVVACGGDDGDEDTATTSQTTEDTGTTLQQGDVETAAQTALAEVDGTVFAVDSDDQGWDVTIVTAEGVENDLELTADAGSVTRGPEEETDDDSDDAAERERLLGVSTDYLAAMEAAFGEVEGTVTGVELSEDDGAAIWEVEVNEESAGETTVEVDAESGEVLRTERDS